MSAGTEVPDSVTHREIQEVLRTFAGSGWTGMTLEVRGMRITVGKNGPPTGAASPAPAAGPPAAVAPAPIGAAAVAPAAVTPAPVAPASAAAAPVGAAPVGAAQGDAAPVTPSAAPRPAAVPPSGAASAGPAQGSTAPAEDTTGCVEVRSPAVGAFWVAPSPGEPPFVQVGQLVSEHEQLAIVEVMKLMNPVIALAAGEIVEILAADAEMVEYDQVLFLIRPADG